MFFLSLSYELFKILVWGIGFICTAVSLSSLLKALMGIVLAKKYGMIVDRISIFGYVFNRDSITGVYTKYMDKFSIISSSHVIYDISRPFTDKSSEAENKVLWNSAWISSTILLLIAVPSLIFGFNMSETGFEGIASSFLKGFGFGAAFQAVVFVCTALYTMNRMKKGIMREFEKCRRALVGGVPYNMLSMKPIEQLGSNYSFAEELMYDAFYCQYLLAIEKFDELRIVTDRVKNILYNREPIMQYTLSYYWLVYYYSRYEINAEYANKFYRAVEHILIKDKDANAKRVQAYYYYAIKQDVKAARRFVDEGLAVVDKFSVGDEREVERKSLMWLDAFLKDRGW